MYRDKREHKNVRFLSLKMGGAKRIIFTVCTHFHLRFCLAFQQRMRAFRCQCEMNGKYYLHTDFVYSHENTNREQRLNTMHVFGIGRKQRDKRAFKSERDVVVWHFNDAMFIISLCEKDYRRNATGAFDYHILAIFRLWKRQQKRRRKVILGTHKIISLWRCFEMFFYW